METKMFFKNSGGDKLCGILSVPDSDTRIPIIILCHGLNSGKDSKTNLVLDEILRKSKIGTFRFDFFAHGESEGKLEDRTLNEFVDDVLNAIAYLKSKEYRRFGIFGGSFGGVAAVLAASRSKEFSLIVLKSPGMGKTSRNMQNYKNDFNRWSWLDAGKGIKIPTLIVHGSADLDVEVEQGKRLAVSIKNSKLEIIEGADHRYTRPDDFEKMIDLISKFIIDEVASIF